MPLDKNQVRHIARLARLSLTEEEITRFSRELTVILDYIDALQQVATDNVQPREQFITSENVFRDDVVKPSLPRETVLAMAPDADDRYFRVPRVIG
ncbi:MAG: Asp-tRNA(Asn)/Glu-tRNA(Gln) amidotransferase subunit GatC [candidate division Zixibacteria bacterium]|jgi:aspartyl-tRNA(Asn)/glutamyl-tRNA(Gln) amidotransferase subunit C|nr:Asp-tRNA(Asn)/Glu-tRNA(Gln) amidotransferase subunit GatC [candidate division Zixibacteria bacterium]